MWLERHRAFRVMLMVSLEGLGVLGGCLVRSTQTCEFGSWCFVLVALLLLSRLAGRGGRSVQKKYKAAYFYGGFIFLCFFTRYALILRENTWLVLGTGRTLDFIVVFEVLQLRSTYNSHTKNAPGRAWVDFKSAFFCTFFVGLI